MFRNKNKSKKDEPFVLPEGVKPHPQTLVRSVPFTFDSDQVPAVNLSKEMRADTKHISLVKGFDAMKKALEDCGMAGLRCEVIVMVDDSYSIMDEWKLILQMVVRYLGAALNLSASGKITVLVYGRPDQPITVTKDNYLQIGDLIQPTFGGTPMGETFRQALKEAEKYNCLVLIGNATDGNPNRDSKALMSNEVIRASGHPVMLKNLAIKSVPYLEEIDDLPSQIEIKKDDDGNVIRDSEGNLVLYRNPDGLRLIDNVDSQEIEDPFGMTDADFARRFAEEIEDCIEVMGHAGHLTDVPGHPRTF